MASAKTKVSVKGQIVIPNVFREEYSLSPGDTVIIREEGGKLFIEKPKSDIKKFLDDMRKKFSKPNYTYSSLEYEKAMDSGEV